MLETFAAETEEVAEHAVDEWIAKRGASISIERVETTARAGGSVIIAVWYSENDGGTEDRG